MERFMKRFLLALLAVLLCSAPVQAQTPVPNPTSVAFTASADHSTLTGYRIGYFVAGATSPIQEADLPLGTPDGTQTVTAVINSRPLGYGVYVAKVRAVAGTMLSEWSPDSNPFSRVPLPPSSLVVR
jgi:hypothetical protein